MPCGYSDASWATMSTKQRRIAIIAELDSLLADAQSERDYYKGVIQRTARELEPLAEFLQWNTRTMPEPPADQAQRSALFAAIDLFVLQANGLPDAKSLKRIDAAIADGPKTPAEA